MIKGCCGVILLVPFGEIENRQAFDLRAKVVEDVRLEQQLYRACRRIERKRLDRQPKLYQSWNQMCMELCLLLMMQQNFMQYIF